LSGLKIEDGKILDKNGDETAKFKAISYDKEITAWLDLCLEETGNLTNLATVISQYKNVIEKIYGKYKGLEMDTNEISKIILEKENYKMICEIVENAFEKARIKAIDNFLLETQGIIMNKLKGDWAVEIRQADSKEKYFKPIKIYKKSWSRSDNDMFFGIEFQKLNFIEAWAGFRCVIKKESLGILKQHTAKYNPKGDNEWWAIGQYLSIGKADFVKAMILDDYSAERFANEMAQMAMKFEAMADEINHLKQQKVI